MIETVRISQVAKDQLITLKRRTGLRHWNELARWAFCRSIAEPSPPTTQHEVDEWGIEMSWKTFCGTSGDAYIAVLRVRCAQDGLQPTDEEMARQFRLHLHRGIGYLVGDESTNSIATFLEGVLTKVDSKTTARR